MNKIDKLKLRKIEEVSDKDLKISPMSYGSSGSTWTGGGGTSDSDCMSEEQYKRLVDQGVNFTSGIWVCGLGYVGADADVWGSGSSSDDSGTYGSGSGSGYDWGSDYGSDDYHGSGENTNNSSDKGGNADGKAHGYMPEGYTKDAAIQLCNNKIYDDRCFFGNQRGLCKRNFENKLQCESPTAKQACSGAALGARCWAINGRGVPANGVCESFNPMACRMH